MDIQTFIDEVHLLSIAMARPSVAVAVRGICNRHDLEHSPLSLSAIRRRLEKQQTLTIDGDLIFLIPHQSLCQVAIRMAAQRDAARTAATEAARDRDQLYSELAAIKKEEVAA